MKPTEEQLKDPAYWPEGATHYSDEPTHGMWYRIPGKRGKYDCMIADEHARCVWDDLPTNQEPGYELTHTRPTNPAWTGEGLPPVGTVCEVEHVDYGWIKAKVIGHDEHGGHSLAVCKHENGYDGFSSFRPIRTPEEVERDTVCEEALGIIKQDYSDESVETTHPRTYVINAVQQLYDAGYLRKPMIRQEIFGILDSILGEEMWPQIKQILDALNIKD